jgi:hypothetical protein
MKKKVAVVETEFKLSPYLNGKNEEKQEQNFE